MKRRADCVGLHRHRSVQVLTDAFNRGRRRQVPGNARSDAAQTAGDTAYELACVLIREAADNDDLVRASEEIGFAHLVPSLAGQPDKALLALGLLGQAYRGLSSPDPDAVRQAAHDQQCTAAEGLERLGHLRSAALCRTNAASALLEKSTVTTQELTRAREHLDFSRQHKQPGSVDWAYTEFSTGTLYAKTPTSTPAERVANLQVARGHFDAALALFDKYHAPLSAIAFAEYAHVLAAQIEAAHNLRVADAVMRHLDDLPAEITSLAADAPLFIGNGIRANPAMMGIADVPAWLTEAVDIPLDPATALEFQAAAVRIDDALAQPAHTDRAGLQHARWWLARVYWELDTSTANADRLLDAAAALRDEPNPSTFLEHATHACWAVRTQLGTPPPPQLLQAIAQSYLRLIDLGTDDAQIASFIKTYDHQVRFVACSLADQGQWGDAVAVLEATRVLVYRDVVAAHASDDVPQQDSATSWVYITHSPEASYVILARDGEPVRGHILQSLGGKQLAASTSSIVHDQVGLFSAQWSNGTSRLTEAVARIVTDLDVVVDAIAALAPHNEGVVLIPSGLYSGLPVAAAVSDRWPERYAYIATSPARHVVHTTPHTWPLSGSTLHAVCAAAPPSFRHLPSSWQEVCAIAQRTPTLRSTTFEDITRSQFVSATTDCTMLHFSGHSYSDTVNPLGSALVLHDGDFTLAELIATRHPNLMLVTLSSCQSSTPAISGLSSESLGLHTAFLYTGCSYVVGSLWPVYDITAAVFMTRFYSLFSTSEMIGLPTISAAVRCTQQWMKTATLDTVEAFLAQLQPSVELPAHMADLPADAVPFSDARNWAPFYVAARRL